MLREGLARLTAFALCAALALGALAPSPVAAQGRSEERQGSQDAAGLLLLGLAAAALIAHLNSRDDDDRRQDRDDRGRGSEADRETDRRDRDDRDSDDDGPRIRIPPPDDRALPISCVNRVLSPNGTITPLYIRECLRREGVNVNRLPEACYREVMGRQNNLRQGYVTRCLARHGYYSPDLH